MDNSTNNYRARSRMLDVIRKSAPVTRPALAKETRLTSAAVGLHVASLLDEGLIEEVGYGESIGGRMPVKIDIARKSNCTLGVALHDGELRECIADGSIQRTVGEKNHMGATICGIVEEA